VPTDGPSRGRMRERSRDSRSRCERQAASRRHRRPLPPGRRARRICRRTSRQAPGAREKERPSHGSGSASRCCSHRTRFAAKAPQADRRDHRRVPAPALTTGARANTCARPTGRTPARCVIDSHQRPDAPPLRGPRPGCYTCPVTLPGRTRYRSQADDTDPEVDRRLVQAYRVMTPTQKAARIAGDSLAVQQLALAGIAVRHPEASADQRFEHLASRRLDRETLSRVLDTRRDGWRVRPMEFTDPVALLAACARLPPRAASEALPQTAQRDGGSRRFAGSVVGWPRETRGDDIFQGHRQSGGEPRRGLRQIPGRSRETCFNRHALGPGRCLARSGPARRGRHSLRGRGLAGQFRLR